VFTIVDFEKGNPVSNNIRTAYVPKMKKKYKSVAGGGAGVEILDISACRARC
jgi:hypothetical protein